MRGAAHSASGCHVRGRVADQTLITTAAGKHRSRQARDLPGEVAPAARCRHPRQNVRLPYKNGAGAAGSSKVGQAPVARLHDTRAQRIAQYTGESRRRDHCKCARCRRPCRDPRRREMDAHRLAPLYFAAVAPKSAAVQPRRRLVGVSAAGSATRSDVAASAVGIGWDDGGNRRSRSQKSSRYDLDPAARRRQGAMGSRRTRGSAAIHRRSAGQVRRLPRIRRMMER